MTLIKFIGFILILFLIPNIAVAENILGTHTVEDITSYNTSDVYNLQNYGYVIPQSIVYEIDSSEVSTLNVTTDTWEVEITILEVDTDTTRLTINITNFTGDTSSETQDLYHLKVFGNPVSPIEILFSAEGYYDTGVTVNSGWFLWEYEFTDVMLYPSTWLNVETDGPVSVTYSVVTAEAAIEQAEAGFHPLLNLIRSIPIVGDLLADSIQSIGTIIEVFIAVVLFAITGWAILFLMFETFVLAHAIAIMQREPGLYGVVGVISVIASDNYKMIMFVVEVFTKMFTLLIDLFKAIWPL